MCADDGIDTHLKVGQNHFSVHVALAAFGGHGNDWLKAIPLPLALPSLRSPRRGDAEWGTGGGALPGRDGDGEFGVFGNVTTRSGFNRVGEAAGEQILVE